MQKAEMPLSPENSELSRLVEEEVGGVEGFIFLCTQGWMAQEELMKPSPYRHVKIVTDGSGEEGRCWHMAHWAG